MATKEPLIVRNEKFIYWMDKDPAKYEQIDTTIESKRTKEALSSPLSAIPSEWGFRWFRGTRAPGMGADRRPKTFFYFYFLFWVGGFGGVGAPWVRHLPQALSQVVTALAIRARVVIF